MKRTMVLHITLDVTDFIGDEEISDEKALEIVQTKTDAFLSEEFGTPEEFDINILE